MHTAIVGIGATTYSRASGRTTKAMAVEACRRALEDAGFGIDDVDGIATFMANDSASALEVSWALGRQDVNWAMSELGGGNVVAELMATADAVIKAGICKAVLVYRSMNGRSGVRFGTVTEAMQVGGDMQFDAASGYLVPPEWFAMFARRHQAVYGSTAEDLGEIAITQRRHALENPQAVRREPLDMEEYLAARWVAEPFRLYDCTSEVDGACALLLVGEDLAAQARHDPVWMLDSAHAHSGSGWSQWPDLSEMYASVVGPRLWERSGLTPADMDLACLYDCFTFTVMASVEGFGFAGRGEVGDFYREGRATYGGDVVINPHGGLLSEGYLHGLNHHLEAALQLRGDAGVRQVPDASLALVSAGGGPHGGAQIYSREHP
jgi:acetyl-CoA acetyltransferase